MNKEPLKILFLAAWYPNRNDSMLGLFVKRHAIAISRFSHITVVTVVATSAIDQAYEVETNNANGITEIIFYTRKSNNLLISGWRYFSAHIAAWKILEATDSIPDVTHVHVLTRAGFIALFFKIRHNIPYIITEHWSRYLAHHGGYKGFFRKKITEAVVKRASAITTVSTALKKGMNAANISHSNWQIIPNVVDTNMFKPDVSLRSSKFRFSHISCFEDKSKNMTGILKAIEKLKSKNIDFEVLMIGDGPDWSKAVELTKELNIEDTVEFVGVKEDKELVQLMNSCHCSIIFSHYETFSIVIPENLACGIPVIATDVGGIPEVLPREFGMLIPPNDIDALANSMEKMINNFASYDNDAMIQYVEENFSYKEVGFRFNKIYKDII